MKSDHRSKSWIAEKPDLLPDFIIGGAMKSGTTTLHSILANHPDVFIPEGELHFFDFDNILQHSAFNFYDKQHNRWIHKHKRNISQNSWDKYYSYFKGKKNFVKGEDSTTYLASSKAARRIAKQEKDIKLIFLLRHPTKRAYSQYFHMLRSGRAIYSFKDTIMYQPQSILQRSLYKEQLRHYYEHIPQKSIKVVLFEDLITQTNHTIRQICEFLEVDFAKLDKNVLQIHSNKAKLPISRKLQIWYNRLFRKTANLRHLDSLSETLSLREKIVSRFLHLTKKAHRFVNPLWISEKPPIKRSTKMFLDDFFFKRLKGINKITSKNILSKWFPDKEKN